MTEVRTVVLVYVVDEEALRDIVKTKWLNCHGECTMEDREMADGEYLSEKRGCC